MSSNRCTFDEPRTQLRAAEAAEGFGAESVAKTMSVCWPISYILTITQRLKKDFGDFVLWLSLVIVFDGRKLLKEFLVITIYWNLSTKSIYIYIVQEIIFEMNTNVWNNQLNPEMIQELCDWPYTDADFVQLCRYERELSDDANHCRLKYPKSGFPGIILGESYENPNPNPRILRWKIHVLTFAWAKNWVDNSRQTFGINQKTFMDSRVEFPFHP